MVPTLLTPIPRPVSPAGFLSAVSLVVFKNGGFTTAWSISQCG